MLAIFEGFNFSPFAEWSSVKLSTTSSGDVHAEIIAAEAQLRDAQLAADVEALDALISDNLLFTGPDGELASKADDLAAHRSGAVKFVEHEPESLEVRPITSTVAMTALRARLTVDVGGVRVEGVYRYTRVWARDEAGAWRVVGGHVSAVPTMP